MGVLKEIWLYFKSILYLFHMTESILFSLYKNTSDITDIFFSLFFVYSHLLLLEKQVKKRNLFFISNTLPQAKNVTHICTLSHLYRFNNFFSCSKCDEVSKSFHCRFPSSCAASENLLARGRDIGLVTVIH